MVKNIDIIEVAIEQLDKQNPVIIKELLVQFLKGNLRVPKAKKINLFDYVATGDEAVQRPFLAGVFMDKEDKVAVASDGHVIIISKSDYKPTKAKFGIIDKKGKSIESGEYVNYRSAIQLKGESTVIKLYDEKTIIDSALLTLAESELNGFEMCPAISITPDTKYSFLFPVHRIPLLLEVGLDGWEYSSKGMYYYKDDDKEVAVMGVIKL